MSEITVTVTDDTPQVTVTNNETTAVSIIKANAVSVIAADSQPSVIINTGVGGVYDTSTLLGMFAGLLSLDELDPTLAADLLQLQSLWARIGTQVSLLTATDEVSIRQAAIDYTDSEIVSTVLALDADTEGRISSAVSVIDQKADTINLRVDAFEQETDDNFAAQYSQLLINRDNITLSVGRLDSIDGPGGDVELLTSRVGITESAIALEVVARELTDGNLSETSSNLSITDGLVAAAVVTLNEVDDRVAATELILGEDGIVLSTMSQSFNVSISNIQTMLDNQWGVTIEEDVNGNKYAAGFKMILHAIWLLGADYVIDDTIFYDDLVYICIADHTASLVNNPAGASAATYWEEVVGGEKTEFSIQADKFYIQIPGEGDPVPVFIVDEDTVTINGDLVVNVIQSSNYVVDISGFKIDPINNTAVFHDIVMTFSSSGKSAAQTALNVADGADKTSTVITAGLVTTGRVELQNASNVTGAGIVGGGSAGTDIRLWAGNTYANRASAPFRVTHAGVLSATGAVISGAVTITGGSGIANLTDAGALATRGTVNATYIDNGSITTDKLNALAVTAAKIAANSITAAGGHITDLAVVNAKIEGSAYLNGKKLSSTSSGSVTLNTQQSSPAITHNLGRLPLVNCTDGAPWYGKTHDITTTTFKIFNSDPIGSRTISYVYI